MFFRGGRGNATSFKGSYLLRVLWKFLQAGSPAGSLDVEEFSKGILKARGDAQARDVLIRQGLKPF